MATPDPAESYALPDCEEPACGLPRTGAGRVRSGWIQIHYSGVIGTEPDRWYCSGGCAAKGLVHADIVSSRTEAMHAQIRAERDHGSEVDVDAAAVMAEAPAAAEALVGVAERAAPGLLGMPG